MADGGFTLSVTLDDDTSRRLKAAADRAGRTVGDYASDVLAGVLDDDSDWSETLRRFEEFDRTGESISVDEAFAKIDARIQELRSKRA